MFQSLIGTVQSTPIREYVAGNLVSIPHRYGSKLLVGVLLCSCDKVSIPHRYGSKVLARRPGAGAQKVFQSLIGTVQSEGGGGKMKQKTPFQSLIGTVQSYGLTVRFGSMDLRFNPS